VSDVADIFWTSATIISWTKRAITCACSNHSGRCERCELL